MGPGDAIHAGFADSFVPEARWPDLTAALTATGDPAAIAAFAEPAPAATLPALTERSTTPSTPPTSPPSPPASRPPTGATAS